MVTGAKTIKLLELNKGKLKSVILSQQDSGYVVTERRVSRKRMKPEQLKNELEEAHRSKQKVLAIASNLADPVRAQTPLKFYTNISETLATLGKNSRPEVRLIVNNRFIIDDKETEVKGKSKQFSGYDEVTVKPINLSKDRLNKDLAAVKKDFKSLSKNTIPVLLKANIDAQYQIPSSGIFTANSSMGILLDNYNKLFRVRLAA